MDSWSVLETLPGTDEDCSDGSTELASWRRTAVMVGRSRSQILEEPRAPWCARRWVALAAIVAFAALLYLLRPLPVYGRCCSYSGSRPGCWDRRVLPALRARRVL